MIDRRLKMTRNAIAVLATGLLATAPALADKPDWAGEGGNAKPARMQKARADDDKARGGDRNGRDPRDGRDARDRADRDRGYARDEHDAPRVRAYFRDRDRIAVHQYYAEQYRRGDCPPGLAKKRNACVPPGLAKRWRIGEPLPRDLRYYDVPASIVLELGAPPAAHRYVRVAADILLIAVGTNMVIDAIEDIGRR